MNRIDFLCVHCSATDATMNWTVKDIDRLHRSLGWKQVGYHYVITRTGEVQKGRPDTTPGAHEPRINKTSIAVCMVGGAPPRNSPEFKKGLGENNYTEAQWSSLEKLIKKLKAEHPAAEVIGHRDVPGVKKACPSFDAKAWWKSVSD